jgi:hypothetical protein
MYRALNAPGQGGQQSTQPSQVASGGVAAGGEGSADSASDGNDVAFDYDFTQDDDFLHLTTTLTASVDVENATIAVIIRKETGEWVYRWASDEQLGGAVELKAGVPRTLSAKIQNIFPDGVFYVGLYIKSLDRVQEFAKYDDFMKFSVTRPQNNPQDKYWKPSQDVSLT